MFKNLIKHTNFLFANKFNNIKIKNYDHLSKLNKIPTFSFLTQISIFTNKSFFYEKPQKKFLQKTQYFSNNNYKNNSSYPNSYNFTKINSKLNHEILFSIFESCDLEPKTQGNHIRLKTCPLCDKPHNNEKSNLNSLALNTQNMLFNCFRCGNKGHVIRILKFLKKEFNLDIINDILDMGNNSNTENEDSEKRFQNQNETLPKYKKSNFNESSEYEYDNSHKSYEINQGDNLSNINSDLDGMMLDYDDNNNKFKNKNYFDKDSNRNIKENFSSTFQTGNSTNFENKIYNINNSSIKNPFNTNFKLSKIEDSNIKSNNNITGTNINHNQVVVKEEKVISPKNLNKDTSKISTSQITNISGLNLNSIKNSTNFKISINNINLINELYRRIILFDEDKLLIVKDYLVNERKLKEEVLRFYKIGSSFEKFKNTDFDFINLPCVSFPMFYPTDSDSYLTVDRNNLKEEIYNYLICDKYFLSRIKVRAIGKEFKNFMRIEPTGAVIWYVLFLNQGVYLVLIQSPQMQKKS